MCKTVNFYFLFYILRCAHSEWRKQNCTLIYNSRIVSDCDTLLTLGDFFLTLGDHFVVWTHFMLRHSKGTIIMVQGRSVIRWVGMVPKPMLFLFEKGKCPIDSQRLPRKMSSVLSMYIVGYVSTPMQIMSIMGWKAILWKQEHFWMCF